ncbi:hypothetical protein LY78DRAFT_594055 [Colletotrichum sublineola]|uniref:NACHT-NTPase and P-loop NTPases N-terminal domain-containing protein n=1 Tax=Colletotrichum sublineola TaxID=1173701 RepID=A0A066XRE0_COLSU|nr:hypothetical protein LY78DRAFT_594055 [Colletotrichum sublineola]KDN71788.1 hypothetical protein CSUB01_12113 [Colletotrichum sublineola]
MPGPQATKVSYSIRAGISSLQDIREIHGNLDDVEDLPASFAEVGNHLPVIYEALKFARHRVQKSEDDSIWTDVIRTMDGCKATADRLEGVYGKVVSSAPAQRMERYRDSVSGMGKEGLVEALMEAILLDVDVLLMVDEKMKVAAESHLATLAEIMSHVSAIPPSLHGDSSASGFYNYGSGPQNVVAGDWQQYNNNGQGYQFNETTFHGVDPFNPG